MNTPDPRLMSIFNTEDAYRQKLAGEYPLARSLFMSALNVGRGEHNAREDERLRQQAEIMNEQLRMARALRMQQIQQSFQHTRMPVILSASRTPGMMSGQDVPLGMDEGMIRMASAAGAAFAHLELDELEKDAGIGTSLLNAGKSVGSGAMKGLGNLATRANDSIGRAGFKLQDTVARGITRVDKGITNTLTRANTGISNTVAKVKAVPTRIENWGANVGNKIESAGAGVPAKPIAPKAPSAPVQQTGYRQPAPSMPPPSQPAPQTQQQAKPPVQQNPPPAAQQAQPSAPAGAKQPGMFDGFLKRTGLDTNAKGKLMGLAAGAGALYLGSKAVGAATNYMNTERQPFQYNAGGANPAAGVNQWGVADSSVPYSG